MSKVTILTKPNRIVIASKGVQGAPGKDGVITPELEGLRDEAQQAAQDAAGSATIASDAAGAAVAAQGAAEDSAGQASASAALAEQARLLGATIGFATKADMDASLAHPDGTLALVTNDPTAENNGTYRWTGSEWVQSADRVSGLESLLHTKASQSDVTAITLLASADDFSLAGWVNVSSGDIGGGSVGNTHTVTPFIEVEPGQIYVVRAAYTNPNVAHAWYDADKQFIEAFHSTGVEADVHVTAPVNAHFARLTRHTASAPTASFRAARASPVSIRVGDETLDSVLRQSADVVGQLAREAALRANTQEELESLNFGDTEGAWPVGRRVYSHEFRRELVADGMFWRLPDGRPVSQAEGERVYAAPDWDEIRENLSSYATAHKVVAPVDSLDGWSVPTSAGSGVTFTLSHEKGFASIRQEHFGGSTRPVLFDAGAPLGLEHYLVFKMHVEDWSAIAQARIVLFNAAGVETHRRTIDASILGRLPRPIYNTDTLRIEAPLSTFAQVLAGANIADATQIGIFIQRHAGRVARVWFSEIETASFRPMITLRFDDQRASVWENAYPILADKGFKGLIAVITGATGLANDPKLDFFAPQMTKAQLLEVQGAGWDLVSHTHTHRDMSLLPEDEVDWELATSKQYLYEELGAGMVARSTVIFPFNNSSETVAKVARRYFDISLRQTHLNSAMPRQPEGRWNDGSQWMNLGSATGDARNAAQLIAKAQEAIDEQGWQTFMFHEVRSDQPTGGLNVNTADFQAFVDWLDANRHLVDVVTVTEAVSRMRA